MPHYRILWLVAAAAAVCAPAFSKRGITPEDYFAFEFASDPHLSPDGQEIAFVLTAVDQKNNRRNSSIWLVRSDGSSAPRRITADGPNANAPGWSPDGSRV